MKALLALWLVVCAASVVAQDAPKPLGRVKEGVYFVQVDNATNILELKDGDFRQWYHQRSPWSGELIPGETPLPRFHNTLRSGAYTTNDGGTIRFVTPAGLSRPSITNEFTFMEFRGKVLLWSASAQKVWSRNQRDLLPSGILEATDCKPEDILEGK